ncbi:MAG: Na/Pi cotransporter family protein, partial [Pseudomonadota bacterium]
AFLPELKRSLKDLSSRHVSAAGGGLLAAMLMQSSAAVALIGAGVASSGMLALPAALALVLGADLGSALMAQVLFLPVAAVIPFALLAGVTLFLKAPSRKAKQIGRILIGFALVLVALGMIRTAAAPIGSNELVQSIAGYFETDLLSAFAISALLAWAMHSSLAAVLTIATFALSGLIAAPVAAALVLGANLGGGLIPLVILWGSDRPARIVALGNLIARGGATLGGLGLLIWGAFDGFLAALAQGQTAILLHIAINAAVIVLALPLVGGIVAVLQNVLPIHRDNAAPRVTALDNDALDHAPLALACAQRELLRMAETLQTMLVPSLRLYRGWDPEIARVIEMRETAVDRMHFEIKIYISRLRETGLSPADEKKTLAFVTIANSLEEAADRIAVNMVALSAKMRDSALSLSEEGFKDLAHFHDQVVTNGQLALSVLTTGDAEAARQLVAEKDRIRIEEQRLQERHLKRLQDGTTASIETTNIHQETLRLLKQINAAMSYVAYPIAEETGDLLGSRLAEPNRGGGLAR